MTKNFAYLYRGYGDHQVTNIVILNDGIVQGTCSHGRGPAELDAELKELFIGRPQDGWEAAGAELKRGANKNSDLGVMGTFFTSKPTEIESARELLKQISQENNGYFWRLGGDVDHTATTLADACRTWQSGRNGGSTPIRGGARLLTGIPHYFDADFIDQIDANASQDKETLTHAQVLLTAIEHAPKRTVDEWRSHLHLAGDSPAMRGIASKEGQDHIDDAIERLVTSQNAIIAMPLWGFSLNPAVALGYGSRFVFRLRGSFNAVPAWTHSGDRHDELEMIGSGNYRILETHQENDSLIIDLEQIETITAKYKINEIEKR